MHPQIYKRTFAELGACYGITRQAVAQLHKKHGRAVLNPDKLFSRITSTARASKLRTLLSDPGERQRITEAILEK